MSETTVVHTDSAPRAIGPYSQAIAARGLLFASGQIPLVPSTGELLRGDIQEQTHQVLRNLAAVLKASGASLSTVVKTTVFLADMGEFAAMNEVYAEHFGDHRPARSTVQAGALPRNVSVEIDAIALVP